jgi:SAM-dependent methyltransferase
MTGQARDAAGDEFYRRVQPRLVPGLRNSHYCYADRLRVLVPAARRWLDVGCGHEFLPSWMPDRERRVELNGCRAVGIDPDARSISAHTQLTSKVIGTGLSLPFADGSFDLVTANMVFEHVDRPQQAFAEIARVLSPGGRVLVHTPNARGYTTILARLVPASRRPGFAAALSGGHEEDVYPTHYRANTPDAIKTLAQSEGLDTESLDLVLSSPQLVRIPVLMLVELLWLRMLRASLLARFRPCMLAEFMKPRRSKLSSSTR